MNMNDFEFSVNAPNLIPKLLVSALGMLRVNK